MSISNAAAFLPADTHDKGRLAALGGGLLLSFDPVFIRLSGVGGYDTAFLFGLFSAVMMAMMVQASDRRGLVGTLRDGGWPLLLSGLLIMCSASTFVLSVKHTSVANTMVIMSGRPVLTALASWVFLREKTPKGLWLTIVGVAVGIFLVMQGGLQSGHLWGDGLALITVTCLGLNGTLWRRYKSMSRMAVVGLGGLFIAVVMSAHADPGSYSPTTWLVMAIMGMGSAPLGRVLNAVSSRYIPASEMATIALSSVVLGPTWVFLLLGERPPLSTLSGGAVVLGAILLYLLTTRRNGRAMEIKTE
ncbi:DMT family transporter [Pseudodesulfovibrio sp.]|uniref:DMT family transporter n=1 Tax=unclassified Pseudodesulfovibrio TaxID=2661612 RepID=UPI003B00087E